MVVVYQNPPSAAAGALITHARALHETLVVLEAAQNDKEPPEVIANLHQQAKESLRQFSFALSPISRKLG